MITEVGEQKIPHSSCEQTWSKPDTILQVVAGSGSAKKVGFRMGMEMCKCHPLSHEIWGIGSVFAHSIAGCCAMAMGTLTGRKR